MKNKKAVKKTEGGFIALTSVLIIGAIVLILGISLFHSALTDYSISTAYQSGQKAAFLADFCLEEGIQKLQEDINYIGGEEIKVNDEICSINFVKQIGSEIEEVKTKEISSLGRAGDQPHFSRSSQQVLYIIESTWDDWNHPEAVLENLKREGDFLKLEPSETEVTILNSATGISCDERCGTDYQCISIGTVLPDANNGEVRTCF